MRISTATDQQALSGLLLVPCFSGRLGKTETRFGIGLGGRVVPESAGECVVYGATKAGPDGLVIFSLGPRKDVNPEVVRCVGGSMSARLGQWRCRRAFVDTSLIEQSCREDGLRAVCEGLVLGAFQFNRHKTGQEKPVTCHVSLVVAKRSRAKANEIADAVQVADATNLARTLAHEPANIINPLTLASQAKSLARRTGLTCRVLDEKQMAKLGMGAMLAVGQGSQSPPRLIILEHRSSARSKPVVLVGKAITFDTGGYSLKDKQSIVGMKYDKCGGTTVMGTMSAVAALKMKCPVVGVIVAAENMISEGAYRPNDIITSMSGKTIEIISTDAEGRLVLADALTYVQRKYKPRSLINLATLTGGVVIALGKLRAGIFANRNELRDRLMAAGDRVHERLWPLPMDDEYFELIAGDDCDMKNSAGREAHAIIGAMFLKQFVDAKVPWAHLDIAGVSDVDKDMPYCPKGATGFGVRLLCEYLRGME